MVEALGRSEWRDGRKSSDRQVPWYLLRIWLWLFCIGYRPDIDSLDILFYRGMYNSVDVLHGSNFPSRNLSSANAISRFHLGFPQVARKNGICHISLTNEFL
jgi:hypothetical protein